MAKCSDLEIEPVVVNSFSASVVPTRGHCRRRFSIFVPVKTIVDMTKDELNEAIRLERTTLPRDFNGGSIVKGRK